jgi:hypothetical protein
MDANTKMIRENNIGFFLPNLSAKGPQNNCPTANPPRNVDKDIWTAATVVLNASEIVIKPGKYKSILNGSNAVRRDKIMITIHCVKLKPLMILFSANVERLI